MAANALLVLIALVALVPSGLPSTHDRPPVPPIVPIDVRSAEALAMLRGATRMYSAQLAPEILGGCVVLALVDVRGAADDGTFAGTDRAILSSSAEFNTVNEAGASTSVARCVIVPPSGYFEFTLTSESRNARVRPIVSVDVDGDGELDLDGQHRPIEPVGTGGATRFIVPMNGYDSD